MLFSSRRPDDADVIRARLRALLDDGAGRPGWLPDDDPPERHAGPVPVDRYPEDEEEDEDENAWSVPPVPSGASPSELGPGWDTTATTGRHRAAGAGTRLDPGPHGTRTLWLVAVLAALAVALWSWAGRPDVAPVDPDGAAVPAASTTSPSSPAPDGTVATATPASDVVVVSVVGLVVSPGLVTLPAGSRVADALAAAGGLVPGADPAAVNAAALLTDGQQIAVGVPGAQDPPATGTGVAADGGTVDLNTATLADLDGLPGIGPVLAQRILDHRAQHGPFTSVQELDDVSGIGPALFAEISPLVGV